MGDKNTPDGWIITILDIMAIVMIVIGESTPPKNLSFLGLSPKLWVGGGEES